MTTDFIKNLLPNMAALQTQNSSGINNKTPDLESGNFSKLFDDAKSKYITKDTTNKNLINTKDTPDQTKTEKQETLKSKHNEKQASPTIKEHTIDNTISNSKTNIKKTETSEKKELESNTEINSNITNTDSKSITATEKSEKSENTVEIQNNANEITQSIDENTLNNILLGSEISNQDEEITQPTSINTEAEILQTVEDNTGDSNTIDAEQNQEQLSTKNSTQFIEPSDITIKTVNSTLQHGDSPTLNQVESETVKSEAINKPTDTKTPQIDEIVMLEENSSTLNDIEILDSETLVNVEDNIDSVIDDLTAELSLTEKDSGKNSNKISQEIIDDMDVTVRSVETSDMRKMMQDLRDGNSGGTQSNAQENIIKMSIEGIDSTSTSTFEIPLSTETQPQTITSDKLINIKQINIPQTQNVTDTEILSQINSKLTLPQENTTSKVNIILQPENLGKVSVEIMHSNEGISAKMIAESAQVKDLLDKSIESLKNTLAAQGVNVNNITVKVEESTASQNAGFGFEQEQFNREAANQSNQQKHSERTQNEHIERGNSASADTNQNDETESENSEIRTDNDINLNGRISITV